MCVYKIMTPNKFSAVIFRDLPYDRIDHTSGCSITTHELREILLREGYGDFPSLSFTQVDNEITWNGSDVEGKTIAGTLTLRASVSAERVGVYTEVLVNTKSDDMAERVGARFLRSTYPREDSC